MATAGVFYVTHLQDSAVGAIVNVMLVAERYPAGCPRFTQVLSTRTKAASSVPLQLAMGPEPSGPRRLPRFRGNFAFHLRDIAMWGCGYRKASQRSPSVEPLSPKVLHSEFSFEKRLRDCQLVFL